MLAKVAGNGVQLSAMMQFILTVRDDPYGGLLEAMQKAPTQKSGCQAASAWAKSHPEFLEAFNLGGGWPPDLLLCGHMQFEDSLAGPNP